MGRKIVIALLALGTVVGFGSGIARWHHARSGGRDRFMDMVAERCVDAARRLDRRDGREGRDGRGSERGAARTDSR